MNKFLGLAIASIAAIAAFVIRFQNPELTETQLFVEHWFDYLVSLCLFYYGYFLYAGREE